MGESRQVWVYVEQDEGEIAPVSLELLCKARELAERVSELVASTPLAVRHMRFIESLRRGDSVYVIPFKREGMVERIRPKRQTIVVFLDSKQVEVAFEEIGRPV